jgi:hypothetical protein
VTFATPLKEVEFNNFKQLHEKFSSGTERNGTLLGVPPLPLVRGVRLKNWKETKPKPILKTQLFPHSKKVESEAGKKQKQAKKRRFKKLNSTPPKPQ